MLANIEIRGPESINGFFEHIHHSVGVYEIYRFNFDMLVAGVAFDQYPDLKSIDCYGVCDNWKQLIERYPELSESSKNYCISITAIDPASQPEFDGWRWHKWGEYIGTQSPTYEYIYDEPVIDLVYCYHIYQIL